MHHDSKIRTLGEVLPAVLRNTQTGSEPSSNGSLAVRLTDSQLAAAQAVAAAPLPAMPMADEQFFAQCLLMLDALPRRREDELGGKLRVRAYEIAIGPRPKDAIEFMVTEALRNCRFYPSTSECVEILGRWERADDALHQRQRAISAVRWEKQARFDEMMRRLAAGDVDQAEIDGLPVSWLEVAETRGHLRRDDDGRYVSRVGATAAPASVAEAPIRTGPACRTCQDVRRILTMEGDEVDCPECGEARPC